MLEQFLPGYIKPQPPKHYIKYQQDEKHPRKFAAGKN